MVAAVVGARWSLWRDGDGLIRTEVFVTLLIGLALAAIEKELFDSAVFTALKRRVRACVSPRVFPLNN